MQYQASSLAFVQGFASSMARVVDPLATGAVVASSDVIITSVTPNPASATAVTTDASAIPGRVTVDEDNQQPQHQQHHRELVAGTGVIVTSTLRAANCNPLGLAALLRKAGTDGTLTKLLRNTPSFQRAFPGATVVAMQTLDVSPTGAPFYTSAPTPLPSTR